MPKPYDWRLVRRAMYLSDRLKARAEKQPQDYDLAELSEVVAELAEAIYNGAN